MGRGPTKLDSVAVYRLLRDHPGQIFHYMDIAQALNIPEENSNNVSTMLARATRKHPEYGFRRVGDNRSGQYVFRNEYALETPGSDESQARPDGKLYEVLGFMGTDTMVVRDENSEMSLWRKVDLP